MLMDMDRLDPPQMNTTQLLLVSTVGLAVNLFGMFAMGGHAHHVGLWIYDVDLFIDVCLRDILILMVDMDTGIRAKNTATIPRKLAMFIMVMIMEKNMVTRMDITSMRLVLFLV
jgi:Co/Zn/Cd efflux system component